jgi:hypothetical protein
MYFGIRREDTSLGQTEDPSSNVEYCVAEEVHNLHLSSGNISFMKSEEYKVSKAHDTHGKADNSRKS